jgi:hypothetical protein
VPRISRRAALGIAGAVVGILGIGWLADALATLPIREATSGPLAVQLGLYRVTLALQPAAPHAGSPCQVTITVRGADGSPLSGLAIDVAATMIEMDMLFPTQRAAEQPDHQTYACALVFAMPGTWQVQARVRSPAMKALSATFDIVVR